MTDEMMDAETFIQEAIPIVTALKDNCQKIADNIVEEISKGIQNKKEIVEKLKDCRIKLQEIAKTAATFDLEEIKDEITRQSIKKLRNLEGTFKLGENIIQLGLHMKSMIEVYDDSNTNWFNKDENMYSLRDIDELRSIIQTTHIILMNFFWKSAADKTAEQIYETFFDFIDMIQKAAKEYNLSAVEFWYPSYSEETMMELENVIQEMKPLYEQFHAYIRHKLLTRYGTDAIQLHGPIPETLYQQVEDRVWRKDNHYEDDLPYKNSTDYGEILRSHQINGKKLVEMAESFYTSMGFDSLGEENWEKYINQECNYFDCYSQIFDKHLDNVTLHYCDDVEFIDYLLQHENMGRLYGVLMMRDSPWYFHDENFLGKAVGQACLLSARSPKHLKAMNLTSKEEVSEEGIENINVRLAASALLTMTRQYVEIRLVTDLLSGKIQKEDLNKHYWKLLEQYAGVEPPIDRTEDSIDLPYRLIMDVLNNENLIRNLQQHILSYQIFKTACTRAGHVGPLYNCDFSTEKEVGEYLKQILSGKRNFQKLSAEPMLAYFEPAQNWLTEYNIKNNLKAGWDPSTKSLSVEYVTSEEEAFAFVEESAKRIYELYNRIAEDLFTENSKAFSKTSKSLAAAQEFDFLSRKAKEYDYLKFTSRPLKKVLEKLSLIADVFAMGVELETYMSNKNLLLNISTNEDILKYQEKSDDPEKVRYNPYILNVFKTSKDPEELKYYWEAWRDKNGGYAKNLLLSIIKSFEKPAKILGISKTQFWLKSYTSSDVKKMEWVIDMVKPLYMDLHYYVRERLLQKYSKDEFSMENGAIPDHLVQQVLAQIWTNESIVEDDFPYNKLPPIEQALKEKNYDAMQMLKIAEDFYQSLGFDPLEETFWNDRVKPQEGSATDVNCHARIYDKTPKVYMRYCDRVSYRKFLQNHGYMGRVHYAVEKTDLPAYFFDSYDYEYPVGEAVILSASSPKHAQKMGYITDFEVTDQTLLNRLIRMGIHTLFNLHRYFVHTKIIAEYLEGDIVAADLNKHYWTYMIKYAGIEPPSNRNAEQIDFPFDFYADFGENQQLRKFMAKVLGYRIYEKLCKISDYEGDLNNCDFYGSKEAGRALKKMMQLGSSQPQQTVLKALLEDISGWKGNSMMNYYSPLANWLKKTLNGAVNDFKSSRQLS